MTQPATLDDQYQVGDWVVYEAQMLLTKVAGYAWAPAYGDEKPKLAGLELECGLAVGLDEVRRACRAEVMRLDPALAR